jgi:1A family penicillin-binding protein
MIRAFVAAAFAIVLIPAGVLLHGLWTFKQLESSVTQKMDQYWLTITSPGREEYLLGDDEQFEVPYMASRLSVSAQPTRILDASDRLIGEFASEKGLYVGDPEQLPGFLKKALVAAEDGTFYQHRGVNWKAIARAALVSLRNRRLSQGGSTITQQLAKMLFTTRRKTLGRKVFELLCARKLERKFTKDQILLMYLNFAYFGHGAFGVESAARFYFGKSAKDLELAEAALLVAVIPSPTKYSPFEHADLAQARHRTVLTRMAKKEFIAASAVERYHANFWGSIESRLKPPEASFWRMNVNEAPYVVEAVRQELEKEFPKERILKGGLVVRTTFELEAQKAAQAALTEYLRAENRKSTSTPRLEGGLAALRPSDGAVLAVVGGSGWHFGNQLNRALDARRPMGSTVKPFVYAAAFETGRFKPEDKMEDAPVRYKDWKPQNYGGKYFGEVTLAEALQRSLNSIAIKLLDELDIDLVLDVVSKAADVRRESLPRNLTLALGTSDMSALQAAASYGMFVNEGRAVRPYWIRSIEDRAGTVLRSSATVETPVVLSSGTCAVMLEVMRGVFGPNGTARGSAERMGFTLPAAGKTGTTNDYRDAWFTGVTPDLAASVWVGHDDMRHALEDKGTGGSVAAPVWITFVKAYYRNRPTRAFGVAR